LTDVDDFVKVLLAVKNNKDAFNQIFHVATRDIPKYNDVYEIITMITGASMPDKHISKPVVSLVSSIDKLLIWETKFVTFPFFPKNVIRILSISWEEEASCIAALSSSLITLIFCFKSCINYLYIRYININIPR